MAFSIGPFFTVLDPRKSRDRRIIITALGRTRKQIAVKRLADLLLPISKTIVIESEYVDLDFRASYGRFYNHSHLDTKRRCQRLHFFDKRLTSKSAVLEVGSFSPDAYLGYIILRPFKAQALGRSVLSERVLWAACPGNHEAYLTCRARHRANLAGEELTLMGAPWMQQDTMVAACASASIWVVNWHMSHRFSPDFRLFYTAEITDLAVQIWVGHGMAMPSEGLSTEQMIHALKEIGYNPMPVEPDNAEAARTVLYQYIESGIPVIISLDYPEFDGEDLAPVGHTVVGVGHTLNRDAEPQGYSVAGVPFCRSADFVAHFVVQDDAVAPFCLLEIIDWTSATSDKVVCKKLAQVFGNESLFREVQQQYPCALVIDRGKPGERVGLLNSFVVPMPAGITLSGEAAEDRALNLVAGWYQKASHTPPQLVLRTLLQLSNDLKVHWRHGRDMPPELASALRTHVFSRWVWVTEVCTYKQFRAKKGRALGQVIQDSASRGETEPVFLAYHMPPRDLQLTDPSGKRTIVNIKSYDSFPSFQRPGGIS